MLRLQALLWAGSLLSSLLAVQASERDERLDFCGPMWYNPSLVEYQHGIVAAAKHTQYNFTKVHTTWINSLYICEGPSKDKVTCQPYDPWVTTRHEECLFDERVRGGKVDNTGLGDVKVWVWPGKGVYTIFGRKPARKELSTACTDLVVYHQWLSQYKADGSLSPGDPWHLVGKDPLPLQLPPSHTYPADAPYVMEKNWMPFAYKEPATGVEHLFATYMVWPHVVVELYPNGSAIHRWTTSNKRLFAPFASYDVHGGPPVVHVPGSLSGTGVPYYLGIMHVIERHDHGSVRVYRHFAFRFAAEPPFAIDALSDELNLRFNETFRPWLSWTAFVNGLYLSDTGELTITYGAADVECRALTLTVAEVELMFRRPGVLPRLREVDLTSVSLPSRHERNRQQQHRRSQLERHVHQQRQKQRLRAAR